VTAHLPLDELADLYNAGWTGTELAARYGVSDVTVAKYRRQLGIPARRTWPLKPGWEVGRRLLKDGYAVVQLLPDDPLRVMCGRHGKNGALEHRVVMARHLGRPLRSDESVHHINGVRDDNRIENLELWLKSQPAGQRVEDLVKWAREIIERYEA